MEIPREKIVDIVERSAFFHERIGPRFTEDRKAEDQEAGRKRMLQWKQQTARGEDVYFTRRLAWDGLNEGIAEAIATRVKLRNPEELPGWVDFLQGAIAIASKKDVKAIQSLERLPFLSSERPLAFEHVFVPFVEFASEKLRQFSGEAWIWLSDTATTDIQRELLKTLSWAADKTLGVEFSIWRALPEISVPIAASPGRQLYNSFIHHLLSGGLATLFLDYPVLARWVGRIMEQWVAFYSEFLLHLNEDAAELQRQLFDGCSLVKVRNIWTGLSDRHSAGKSVLRVTFQNGVSCFYKPRNCKPESDYNYLLNWINQLNPPLQLKTYKVINRSGYGWIEEIEHHDCEDQHELERYYERAGMLLALLYALQASDCNFENLISYGEHPVLIDAETLFQPRPRAFDTDEWKALEAASQAIYYDSVFRLSLLPQWIARPDGDKMDVSGFGSGPGKRGSVQKRVWTNVNTDQMSLRKERVAVGRGIRGVQFRGEAVDASRFVESVLTGFEWMYRFLLVNRELLWAADGPLQRMMGLPTRIVPRNTVTYAGLLENCLLPQHLRDGMDVSIWVEALARRFSRSEEKPPAWDMVAAEEASLLDLNIPRFEARSDSDAMRVGPERYIGQYFVAPGFCRFKERFDQLSAADLDLQKCYIRHSFGYFATSNSCVEPVASGAHASSPSDVFIQQALAIAGRIQEKAVQAPDGSAGWITQVYNMDSQFWQLQPMGLNLYDGLSGIALFLAALERTTGETRYRDLLSAVLKVLCHFASPQMQSHLAHESVGAGLGTASLAYSLARVGWLLEDERLVDRGIGLAAMITAKQLAADRRLDVIGGSAGCLLVLRTLYRLKPRSWMLDRAVDCGEHLLETRTATASGLRSWATIRGKFLAGFSHGAAGIIYALSELYKITGRKNYLEAALEAQEYEDSLFCEEKQNWPNLLLPTKDGGFDFWNSWCHGAPGIGLARLAGLECLDRAATEKDLESALQTAAARQLTDIDTPCCGNLGRIELLVQASQTAGRNSCLETAREIGLCVVDRAGRQDGYGTGIKSGIYIPSFHQGMAGVGYQLLRLAKPEQLPSVLCWE